MLALKIKPIVEQLVDIYMQENWQKDKMSDFEAYKYHNTLLNSGNIKVYSPDWVVLGYIEVWFIDKEYLAYIISNIHNSIKVDYNKILNGNIAYLANLYIDKNFRHTFVDKIMHNKFNEMTKHCYLITGFDQKRDRVRTFNKRGS